jgi:hypothetical protein
MAEECELLGGELAIAAERNSRRSYPGVPAALHAKQARGEHLGLPATPVGVPGKTGRAGCEERQLPSGHGWRTRVAGCELRNPIRSDDRTRIGMGEAVSRAGSESVLAWHALLSALVGELNGVGSRSNSRSAAARAPQFSSQMAMIRESSFVQILPRDLSFQLRQKIDFVPDGNYVFFRCLVPKNRCFQGVNLQACS